MVVGPALRCAMVTEEHHAGMITLGSMRKQIEGGIVVEQEVVWSSALRSDDIWPLDWISAEEDWEVETDNVIVALPLFWLANTRS